MAKLSVWETTNHALSKRSLHSSMAKLSVVKKEGNIYFIKLYIPVWLNYQTVIISIEFPVNHLYIPVWLNYQGQIAADTVTADKSLHSSMAKLSGYKHRGIS